MLERIRPAGADIDGGLSGIVALEDERLSVEKKNGGWNGLRQPWVRPALIVGCGVAVFTQLMGWLTDSEIYPLAVRGAGTAAQSASLWGTNLLITLTLLTIIETVGVGQTMWLYGAFNVAAWIFIVKKMRELTGRNLEQIEGKLAEDRFAPKDFDRLPAPAREGADITPA